MFSVGSKFILDNDNDNDDDDDDDDDNDEHKDNLIWRNIRLIAENWIFRRRRAFVKKLVVINMVKYPQLVLH